MDRKVKRKRGETSAKRDRQAGNTIETNKSKSSKK